MILIIFLNGVNILMFVMVKCSAFFAVRTGLLNTVHLNFGFKVLKVVSYARLAFGLHENISLSL